MINSKLLEIFKKLVDKILFISFQIHKESLNIYLSSLKPLTHMPVPLPPVVVFVNMLIFLRRILAFGIKLVKQNFEVLVKTRSVFVHLLMTIQLVPVILACRQGSS